MNINTIKINELLEAYAALDGQQIPVQTSDKNTRIILQPYNFSGSVRIKIAKNIFNLKLALEPINSALREAGKAAHANSDGTIPTEFVAGYLVARDEILRELNEVNLVELTASDLNLDENKIPATLLSVLLKF